MPSRDDTTSAQDDYVSWRDADLRARQSARGRIAIRALAVGIALTGFVVLLMNIQRDTDRCHQNCFDGSDNTFEAGHAWTAYFGSWQWDAQLVIGWLGFLASLWALYAAGRKSRRATVASLGLSLGLIALWIVWVTVQPPPGDLA
jgi:hypothetical protein